MRRPESIASFPAELPDLLQAVAEKLAGLGDKENGEALAKEEAALLDEYLDLAKQLSCEGQGGRNTCPAGYRCNANHGNGGRPILCRADTARAR